MDLYQLKKLLELSWNYETCSPGLKSEWSEENPSLGQCAITALIVQDYFGGKIMRCMMPSGSHYYNLIDNRVVDFTVEQFEGDIPNYEKGEERTREYLLSNEDTKNRYEKLLYYLNLAVRQVSGYKFKLIGPDGKKYLSDVPGKLGGHNGHKIYGKLDCRSAKYWIEKGKYVDNRVFFLDEKTAIEAGYRPCAICMPKEYKEWKEKEELKRVLKKEN